MTISKGKRKGGTARRRAKTQEQQDVMTIPDGLRENGLKRSAIALEFLGTKQVLNSLLYVFTLQPDANFR